MDKTAEITVSPGGDGLMAIAQSREVAEIQTMAVMARNYPRDPDACLQRMLPFFCNPKIAEEAIYIPQKGKDRTPRGSIRMAEIIAQQWGHMDYGINVIRQEEHQTHAAAHCWDMQLNLHQRRTFLVSHMRERTEANGGDYLMVKASDILAQVMNIGSRQLRTCIMNTVPKSVEEMCVAKCLETKNKALSQARAEDDRRRRERQARIMAQTQSVLDAFSTIGVSREAIENRTKKRMEDLTEANINRLHDIYEKIQSGESLADQEFPLKSN